MGKGQIWDSLKPVLKGMGESWQKNPSQGILATLAGGAAAGIKSHRNRNPIDSNKAVDYNAPVDYNTPDDDDEESKKNAYA